MTNTYETLKQKITEKRARIAVVGLGYVGLPLAVEKARAGFHVIGIERNPERVTMVNSGENYISDILAKDLSEVVEQGNLVATKSFDDVATVDVITICVPTPLDRNK